MQNDYKQPTTSKDDLSIVNDVRDKAWAILSGLHFLTRDPIKVIDFDLSKARHLSEFTGLHFDKKTLQEGRDLAKALKADFFGAASRIAKHGTPVERNYMKDACWILSVATRQFKSLTRGMPGFEEVAGQLDGLDASEKRLLEDLVREAEKNKAYEIAKTGFALIWQAIKLKFGAS